MAKKPRTPKPPRPAATGERRVQAPQRRTGPAKRSTTAAPPRGMRYFWPIAAVVVALAIVGIALGIVLTRGPSKPPGLALPGAISWNALPGLQTGKPPWPNDGTTLTQRLPVLGLTTGSTGDAAAFHIHQHLDVFVNGQKVSVPLAVGYGIDPATGKPQFLTELHTHNALGIIHVESAKHLDYQLKQFFGEWGVRLTAKCLGSFKGSCDNLQWWVNGVKRVGDPGNLILKSHEEIVITVGTLPANLPKSYDFKAHGV